MQCRTNLNNGMLDVAIISSHMVKSAQDSNQVPSVVASYLLDNPLGKSPHACHYNNHTHSFIVSNIQYLLLHLFWWDNRYDFTDL